MRFVYAYASAVGTGFLRIITDHRLLVCAFEVVLMLLLRSRLIFFLIALNYSFSLKMASPKTLVVGLNPALQRAVSYLILCA